MSNMGDDEDNSEYSEYATLQEKESEETVSVDTNTPLYKTLK